MGTSAFVSIILSLSILSSWTVRPGTGERILILLPIAPKSTGNLFEPIITGLAERGHELTIVASLKFDIRDPQGKPAKNVTQLTPVLVEELLKDYPDPFDIRKENALFNYHGPFLARNCRKVYQNEGFMQLVTQKFDLIIQNIVLNDCFAGLVHKLGSPVIQVGPLPIPSAMLELFGNHHPSSFIPLVVLGDISPKLSFIQRTKNFLYNAYFKVMLDDWTRPPQEEVYREYLGNDIPSIQDIYKKQVSMILMNSHFSVTRARPLLPSIVEIGGIHCRPSKPLPKDLEEFVSGGKDGVIVFSMGSIVKAAKMPESVRLAFVRTFAKLKQRVIWKWEKDGGMPDAPSNVKVVKWIPQQDLLGHPNVKLFITHGGLLSTEEAVYHGVPVLGMPIFSDQDSNMKHAEDLGFGLKGEILGLTEAKLERQLRRILEDPRYMQRAKELSKIFRDQPETPLERAMYWVEYVLRHKGAFHFQSAGMNLNVIQYNSIDVILFLTGIVIVSILLVYLTLKLLLQKLLFATITSGSKRNAVKMKRKRQ